MTTAKDYRNDIRPNWCPGCGHYGVQAAITDAVVAKNIPPEKLAVISGIGCSSRIGGYFYAYGAHTTHGRALPYAQGVKLANQDLEVIAFSGDGDAFAIGMGHTIHAFKRNVNMTYVVMDNQLYALTKGQMSPKSDEGLITTTTLEGVMEKPLSAMKIALSCEVTFLAQAFTGDMKEMMQIFEEAVNHDGFSLVNVFSPCKTYNYKNTPAWYKEHLTKLSDIEGYDNTNKLEAYRVLEEHNDLVTGVIYKNEKKPHYEDTLRNYKRDEPIAHQNLEFSEELFNSLCDEFR